MKVLIITYYWPPAGGSGVQRWLKFVKYLRNFDVEPVVFTAKNANYSILDESLQKEIPEGIEILKIPIKEPNKIFSRVKSKQHKTSAGFLNSNPSLFEKIARYIRANYFIPDTRKFWIRPSVNFLSKYLENNKIDAIITTGPPHSLHLIGMELKKKLEMNWIADFRDPWTDIDYFHQLPLTEKAKQKHFDLEKKVLNHADAVLVVSRTMKNNIKKFNDNIHVITNGFDGDIDKEKITLDKEFSITHIGMMNADRNPKILWRVIKELVEENSDFKNNISIKLIGEVAQEVGSSIEKYGIKDYVKFIPYKPHTEVMSYQKGTQLLLLVINDVPSAKGIITGKVFEYLQANRPILAIAPEDGDLAEIINKTNTGVVFDFYSKETLKQAILDYYERFKKGTLEVSTKNVNPYHRKKLTEKLVKILKATVSLNKN